MTDYVEHVKYTVPLGQIFLQVLWFSLCQHRLKKIPQTVYKLRNRIHLQITRFKKRGGRENVRIIVSSVNNNFF